MGQRLELQALLEELMQGDKVYFQPPANVQLEFPCIIYQRDFARTEHANNRPYRYTKRYQLTFISQDPDHEITDEIAMLPLCTFERHFKAGNLNHDVFTIFF